jgi:hypothetical protein
MPATTPFVTPRMRQRAALESVPDATTQIRIARLGRSRAVAGDFERMTSKITLTKYAIEANIIDWIESRMTNPTSAHRKAR